MVDQGQRRRLEGGHLAGQLGADRPAAPGHQDATAADQLADGVEVGVDLGAAEQVGDLDVADVLQRDLAAEQLGGRRHDAETDAELVAAHRGHPAHQLGVGPGDREDGARRAGRLDDLGQLVDAAEHRDPHGTAAEEPYVVVDQSDDGVRRVVTHVTEQCRPDLAGADDQQPLADGARVTAAGGDGLPAQHPGPEPDRTCEPARQDRGHDRDRERDRPPQQQHQGQQHREHDHLDHEDLPRLQDAGEPEQSGVEPHDGVAAEREDEDHGHEAEKPGPLRPRHIPVVAQEQCSRPRQHDQQYVPHEQRSRCARPRLHFIPT